MTVQLSSLRVTADMDVAGYVRAAAQKQAADKGILTSSQEVGRALAAQDAAAQKLGQGVQSVSRQWVDGYASAARFEKAVRDVGRAMDTGLDAGRAAAALDGIYRKFGMVADAATLAKQGFVSISPVVAALNQQLEVTSEVARRAAAATAQLQQARAMQTDIASRLRMDAKPYDARGSASVFEADFAKQQADMQQRAKALTQRLLPMEAELERTKGTRREILDLEERGIITRKKAVDLLLSERSLHEQSKRSIEGMFINQSKYGNGGGLARHEAINLSRQMQDVFVSLQGGQAPLTVLIQQGTQIADIFAASNASVSGFFGQVMSYVTPARVAMVGLTGVVLAGAAAWYSYSESHRAVALSLEGIGRGSGLTVGNINAIAEASARLDRMSISQARGVASTIAGTGKVDRNLVGGITEASYGYGLLTGQGVNDAGKALAGAFADPVRGAEQLNERLGFLNGSLSDYIRNAVASGDRAGAQRAMLEAMASSIERATEHTNKFTKAWATLGNVISNIGDTIGGFLTGSGLQQQLAVVEQQIAKIDKARSGPWGGSLGLDGRYNSLQTERDRLRASIDYENRKAAAGKRDREAADLGMQGNSVIRSIVDDIGRLEGFRNNKSLLERLIGDPEALAKSGMSADQARTSLDRTNIGLATFQTAAQRAAQDGQMQVQQIMAYTLAERAAAEAQLAYVNALRSTQNAALAAVEAENARNRVVAEANRQARDMLRDANFDAKLVGLSPYERGLQQIRNERDKYAGQTFGMSSALQAPAQSTVSPQLQAEVTRSVAEMYVRAAAAARGIDPDTAARVIKQESGFNVRATNISAREESYGLMQLNAMGGLGATALQRGINIRDPNTWRDQVNFGLDVVARDGWRQWYGARDVGIGRWDGIGGRPANDNGAGQRLGLSSDGLKSFAKREATYIAEQQVGPINQANLALSAQEAILGKLRQTIGATPQETARLNAEIDLMKSLLQAGVPITDAMQQKIEAYGIKAGVAAESVRKINFAQKQLDELKSLERDVAGGFLSDIVNGLRRGENGWKLFGQAGVNALNKIADTSIKMMLDQAFFNQPGGGLFGSLIKGLLGGGGGFGSGMSLHAGGLSSTGMLYAANGNVFDRGNVIPFARGGVFDTPTYFPMAGGRTGLAGEAGPEAIMPLARGRDGKLGLHMVAAPAVNTNIFKTDVVVQGDVSQGTIVALRKELDARDAANQAAMMAITKGEQRRLVAHQARLA